MYEKQLSRITRFRNQVLGIILAASIGLLYVSYISHIDREKVRSQNEADNITLKVLKYSEFLFTNIQDIETGYRGYLLTNDTTYLKPYTGAINSLQINCKELEASSVYDPHEKSLILSLCQTARENEQVARTLVDKQAAGTLAEEEKLRLLKKGKSLMNLIRDNTDRIEQIERNNLHANAKAEQGQVDYTSEVFTGIAIALIAYFIASYFVIQRLIRKRLKDERQLLENEDLFSKLFYSSPFKYALAEKGSGVILKANKEFLDYYGFTPEEAIGKTSTQLGIFPFDTHRLMLRSAVAKSSVVRGVEVLIKKKNGEERWVSCDIDCALLMNKECMLVAITDINDAKATEERIRKLNARLEKKILERTAEVVDYKYALDAAAIVAITDNQGTIKYVNENFCSISKYDADELIGENHRIINSGYHSPEFFKELWRTIGSGQLWKGEIRNKAKDGTLYWVDTTIIPFLNENNKPYQYLVIRFDITQKKNMLAELQRSEANIRSIYEHTDIGFVLISNELNILSFNSVAFNYAFLHWNKTLEVNRPAVDYFPPERRELANDMIHASLRGRTGSYEVNYINEDGSSNWYFMRYLPVTGDGDEIMGMMIQMHNISERKNLELFREKMTADLIQRNRDLEQFAYIVSHNLRAPVANILGLTAIMKSDKFTPENEQIVREGINSSVLRLDEVIRDLNQILQVRREITDKKEAVSLSNLVEDITYSIAAQIKKEKAQIRVDFSAIDEIFTLKSYLHSIFYNLISNSLKYRHADIDPVIEIRSVKDAHMVSLIITDNGSGIDLTRKGDQIFGLYKRFHHEVEGKGMGLYMVKTQVETLGGQITVSSQPNVGTTFTIQLHL